MLLTEPPCKALGIYVMHSETPPLKLVERVWNPHGIRVGQFLLALEAYVDKSIARWKRMVERDLARIKESHWTQFTTHQEKRNALAVEAHPKFIVFLEDTSGADNSLARSTYPYGEDFEQRCEEEWYEDQGTS